MNDNIFSYKTSDAVGYLFFYIVLPCLITWLSFKVFPIDMISGTYCYVTVLVSILNNAYDAMNRWLPQVPSARNTKLLIILVADFAIIVYCLVIILSVFIIGEMSVRHDKVLFIYLLVCFVAMWDITGCFLKEVKPIKINWKGEAKK